MTQIPTVGTISHGTLRPQDLIARLTDALSDYGGADDQLLIGIARSWLNAKETDANEDEANELLNDLFERLDTIAGRHGMYFGAHEGDGSDFGFWPLEE